MIVKRAIIIIFLFCLLNPFTVFAVTQGPDEITLNKPTEGQTISDTFNLEWKMTDADIADPAYFIDVFNLSCNESGGNLGRVTNSGATRSGDIYSYSWNTKTGNFSGLLQDQGNYCMRVCGILANGGSVYSLCDKKSFIYSSNQTSTNKPPVIEGSKEGFVITLNEVFSYQVKATDPEGDTITYSFVSAPDFLSINPSTGLISGTKPTEVGDLRFIVKADDGKGGIATEEFIIRIQPESEEEVEFTFPKSGSVLSPQNNKVKWSVNNGIRVRTIVLGFSQDRASWTELTRLDRNTGEYTWNISDMEPGDYYLRIQLTDTSNKLFEVVSDKFSIDTAEEVSETSITDLVPAEGSTIQDTRPIISAKFSVPEGTIIDLDSVSFTLNERTDLTVCDVLASGITCEVVSELLDGNYKAYIELMDSKGATVIKEWNFSVASNGDGDQDGVAPRLSGNTLQLIVIIFAVGFVLIALPWSLYLVLRRKRNKSQEVSKLPPQQIQPVPPSEPIIGTQGLGMVEPPTQNTQNIAVPQPQPQLQFGTQEINNPVTPNVAVEPVGVPASVQSMSPAAVDYNTQAPSQPKMYEQDEIPEWMKKDVPDNTVVPDATTIDDVITKTDIAEGARVYDPYGLALNPDETEDNT